MIRKYQRKNACIYWGDAIQKYMASIEEIINIPQLVQILNEQSHAGHLVAVIDDILLHSKVEFHCTI